MSDLIEKARMVALALGTRFARWNAIFFLGVFYFLFLTPVAVFLRLRGRTVLKMGLDPGASTYRIASRQRTRESMEMPF